MGSTESWFECVRTLDSDLTTQLAIEAQQLQVLQRRSGPLGRGSRVTYDRFWAKPNNTSERFHSFEPADFDSRLKDFPAMLEFLAFVELDSQLPQCEVQININQYDAGVEAESGWHKDERANGRSKIYVATVEGDAKVKYIERARIVEAEMPLGQLCIFHNELKRRRHNVVNVGEGERVGIVAWQPHVPRN